jgi:hypothetical protein
MAERDGTGDEEWERDFGLLDKTRFWVGLGFWELCPFLLFMSKMELFHCHVKNCR